MRLLLASALAVWASLVFAQTLPVEPEAPEITKAKSELVRLEQLVEAGGVPRNRLEQARQELSEAMDRAVLRRTLYGSLKVEDLTEPLAKQMLDSAQRLVSNQQK
jgi:multidrug resistance efflux pump